jgi:hypothetical protein
MQILQRIMITFGSAAILLAGRAGAQTVIIGGLESPYKLSITATGNLMVTEAGKQPNGGRVSLLEPSGRRTVLVSGLPSGAGMEGRFEGPTSAILREQTLYILIGQGDVLANGTVAGTEVSNPKGPSSPIFSSLLAVRFSSNPESVGKEFALQPADHFRLADGLPVEIDHGAGEKATVEVITDFRDVTPDPNTIVRGSNPFGMDLDASDANTAYVVDSGLNKLVRVDLTTGRARTVTTFPPIRNTGFGPPVSDTVPTSVHAFGDRLLVTYLSGFPFTPGVSGALIVDPKTGATQQFIGAGTTAMDLVWRDLSGHPQFFMIEFSANLAAENAPPGRLIQYDTLPGQTLQAGLITPVGLALNPKTGDLFVSELGTGRILKVAAK